MILPCEDCIHRVVKETGHRTFISCEDAKLKADNFREDDYTYHHKCSAYIKGNK